MVTRLVDAKAVLKFWFEEISESDWFNKNPDIDQIIRDRFMTTYDAATRGDLYAWRQSASGRLAEIILLDQFSRNMFRESARAFAFDSVAVVLSQQAIQTGDDQKLPIVQRKFFYMPLMHSESLIVHELALKMFSQPGLEDNFEYEIKHKNIIERFGRYPHRNRLLGRLSTIEEIAFLNQPGSSF